MQVDQNAEVHFPNWQNIADTFKINPFQNTKAGRRLLRQWENNVKISKWIKRLGYIIGIVIIVQVIIENGKERYIEAIIAGIIAFFIFYIIHKLYKKTIVRFTEKRYFKKRNLFTQHLLDVMVEYFRGYGYWFSNAHCFVFNKDMCIYINANEGSWIGFHKGNIKDVELEHVMLGSTTISTTHTSGSAYAWTNNYATYSGTSTTVSNTSMHYEWRLDIYTNFDDYPHLTVVFSEGNDGEEYAKKAKALLKP